LRGLIVEKYELEDGVYQFKLYFKEIDDKNYHFEEVKANLI
jgi:hypothetical protein